MWLLGFLLLPIILATGRELTINNYVVKIEDDILKSVEASSDSSDTLDLSNVHLKGLNDDVFPAINNVKILSLANNELSSIPQSGLSKLTNLEHLDLSNNRISSLNRAFVGLGNLKTLNLTGNPLSNLVKGSLFELGNSSNIFVTPNSLFSISRYIFDSPIEEITTTPKPTVEEIHKGVFKYNPKIHGPSAYFGPQPPATTEPPQPPVIRAKICIQDKKVKSLSALQENEALANGCTEVNYDDEEQKINLQNLGISGFERGWYKLGDSPVRAIDLDHNQIVRLTSQVLNDLPENVKTVTIRKNLIERLERNAIENIYLTNFNLDLSDNFIREIENGALSRVNGTGRLRLDGNRITSTQFVATLPGSITELSLKRNLIDAIETGSLSSLVNISRLLLDGNNITNVQKGALLGVGPLRHLTLSNNSLRGIESGAFEGLSFIRHLDLANNKMSKLPKDMFKGLGMLLGLNISGNQFTKINQESLAGLPRMVHYLWLDNNGIESLEEKSFVGTPILDLTLNNNRISKIDPGSFKLPYLRSMELNNNLLSRINPDSYQGTGSMERLEIAGNGISKIEKGAAKYWHGLEILDISDNPIDKLQNGALFGIQKYNDEVIIRVQNTRIELLQGGLFEDV